MWLEHLATLLILIIVIPFVSALLHSRWVVNIIFLLMGSLLVWSAVEISRGGRILRRSAETVPAIITDKDIYSQRRRMDAHNLYLEYRLPSSEKTYTRKTRVSRSTYEQVRVGGTINLMVATEDPSIVELEQNYPPSRYPSVILIGLGLFFFVMSIGNLYET